MFVYNTRNLDITCINRQYVEHLIEIGYRITALRRRRTVIQRLWHSTVQCCILDADKPQITKYNSFSVLDFANCNGYDV